MQPPGASLMRIQHAFIEIAYFLIFSA